MRELLNDKYLRLKNEYETLKKERAGRLFGGIDAMVGLYLYECQSSPRHPMDELLKWNITGYSCIPKDRHKTADKLGHYSFPTPDRNKKPTKALIAECESYIEKYKEAPDDEFEVIFYVESRLKIGLASMGVRFSPGAGFEYNKWSFDPEWFDEKIAKDREEYEKFYAPREGYVACERCGKQVPENEAVKYKLIYQGWDQYAHKRRVMDRVGTFCSGECAMNEQMSLEG